MPSPHTPPTPAWAPRALVVGLCVVSVALPQARDAVAETVHMAREALPIQLGTTLDYKVNPWGKRRSNRSLATTFTIAQIEHGDDALPNAVTVDVVNALRAKHAATPQPMTRIRASGLDDAPMMRFNVQATPSSSSSPTPQPDVGSLLWLGRAQCLAARYRGEVTLQVGAPGTGARLREVRMVWTDRARHTLTLDGREASVEAMVLTSQQGDRMVVLDDCTTPLMLHVELHDFTASLRALNRATAR